MSQHLENIGPYQLESELGHGAMARVWRAWDPNLEREVAIKVPSFGAGLSGETLDELGHRFVAEGRAAAKLSHPGIVTVYAADVWDGVPAIVMELIDGSTLSGLLDLGPLPAPAALNVLDQLLDAVGYAHAHGVIHRDIKPDNIFVSASGAVKLADFGIAHVDGGAASHATVAGTVLGTPGYLSPEQARGTAVDARSDLFSIGVVAYEMLTGYNPFSADNNTDITTLIYRIVHEPAPEIPDAIAQDLPAAVRPAIMAALSKDPNDRPASAGDFKLMLHGQMTPTVDLKIRQIYQTITSIPPANTNDPTELEVTRRLHQKETPPETPPEVTQEVLARDSVIEEDSYRGDNSEARDTTKRNNTSSWLPFALVGGVCAAALIFALISAMGGGGGTGGGGDGGSSYSTYLSLYNGYVAIYTSNSTDPYLVTDVAVSDLSPENAAQLGGQVAVSSVAEAENLVEQYRQLAEAEEAAKKAEEEAAKKAEEEAAKKAEEEAARKAEEEAAKKAEEEKKQSEVVITVTGADGSTRTATIHRDPGTQRVIPDSNSRALTQSEVNALSDAERCIAWNEIIASSNGYAFKNSTLASYFADCTWYSRNTSASSNGDLSSTASKNVTMLQNATSDWWKHLATN